MRLLCLTFSIFLLLIGCESNSKIDNKVAGVSRNLNKTSHSDAIISDEFYDEFSGEINDKTANDILILTQERFKKGESFLTIDKFDDTIDYYERVKDSVALLNIYYLASIRMMHKSERDSAAIYLKKAIDLSSDSSTPSKTELYSELSNLYARPSFEKDYRTSIKFAKLALSSANSSEDKARAKHDIGLFYSFINENDSAVIYLEDALTEIEPENELYTAIALNYGNTPKADFKKSVAYLKSIKGESLGKLITLGFIYLNNSQIDSALNYYAQSKKLYNGNPGKYSINTYNNLRLLEQSLNLLNTGVIHQDNGTVTNDSISELTAIKKIVSEEQREYNEKLMISLLKQKAHKRLLWVIGLSIFLALVCGFVLYVWYSNRKYLILKRKLDNIKIDQIVTEANDEINEKDTSLMLINKRLEICIEQFRALKLQSEIEKIEFQYRSTGNYPPMKSRELIQKKLIGCFADFIVDLKMTGAKLSMDDIITCILTSLKESNATIAACLGATDSAVRTRKSRLRTKLPDEIGTMIGL